jgi:hypothetical protein
MLTPFTFSPSLVLQPIVFSPSYSFCPFSSSISSCLHLSLLAFPNLSSNYPSLLHIYHLLLSLLYQPYTPPGLCSPLHKHPPLNSRTAGKHIQGPQNTAAPIPFIIPTPTFWHHLYQLTKFLFLAKKTITPCNSTVYRYYHQGVFYVNNWSGIESVNLLMLIYISRPGTEIAHQSS